MTAPPRATDADDDRAILGDEDITVEMTTDRLARSGERARAGQAPALFVVMGREFGQVFVVDAPDTILGRSAAADVCLYTEGISRAHAKIVRRDDGRHVLEDLGSKNGTYLNDRRITGEVLLKEGDAIRLGVAVILQFGFRSERVAAALVSTGERQTLRDALTGAWNRRVFDERIASGTPCAVAVLDVDGFDRFAQREASGDAVLVALARVASGVVRKDDTFARLGGERFGVVAQGCISLAAMATMSERLRAAFEARALDIDGHSERVTISVGVTTSADALGVSSSGDLVARAVCALERAKRSGGNCVEW